MILNADVVVAGGGHAGCAAAITLSGSGKTVVLLRRAFTDKGLPETLSPAAVPILVQLGLNREQIDCAFPRLNARLSQWGRGSFQSIDMLPNSHAPLLLGKSELDAQLISAVRRSSCQIVEIERIEAALISDDGILVRSRTANGAICLVRAQAAIEATGRSSSLARQFGVRRKIHDSLVSFWISGETWGALSHATLTATVGDGWIFFAPNDPGRGSIGYFTAGSRLRKKPSAASIAKRALSIPDLAACIEFKGWCGSAVTTCNSTMSALNQPYGDGWIACGDALQTLDPLASSGNFLALRQGLDAANVLSSIDRHERMDRLRKYCGDAREDFETVLSRRSRFYGTSEQLRTATM
ncbi:hypothetical protein AS026_29195 [Rhizobium altiplani]|uniref:FAD-binding domain-containing protein n=1 Tax=Rhizobium altiplani TaxID=1864509 RepID=A0A125QA24_9HYPH|nr:MULTISPECIES: FAD-dependent monooxygenase [Rhizobium]KWV59180.1 hypothetical protein AS026_29195 [Rhizobium altiplani]